MDAYIQLLLLSGKGTTAAIVPQNLLIDEFGNFVIDELDNFITDGTEQLFDVTSTGGTIREGEAFSLGDFGDLTGTVGVTIDGVACTSVVVAGDNLSLTAVAPADGVRYNEAVAIRLV